MRGGIEMLAVSRRSSSRHSHWRGDVRLESRAEAANVLMLSAVAAINFEIFKLSCEA